MSVLPQGAENTRNHWHYVCGNSLRNYYCYWNYCRFLLQGTCL